MGAASTSPFSATRRGGPDALIARSRPQTRTNSPRSPDLFIQADGRRLIGAEDRAAPLVKARRASRSTISAFPIPVHFRRCRAAESSSASVAAVSAATPRIRGIAPMLGPRTPVLVRTESRAAAPPARRLPPASNKLPHERHPPSGASRRPPMASSVTEADARPPILRPRRKGRRARHRPRATRARELADRATAARNSSRAATTSSRKTARRRFRPIRRSR